MSQKLRFVECLRALFGPRAERFVYPRAVRSLFLNTKGEPLPPSRVVLSHLARFCRASKPTVMFSPDGRVDALASARMDGRREVFLLIQEALNLDDQYLLQIQNEEHNDGR